MPYTRKQVKYLLSSVSPLSGEQQDKVKAELHADPSLGHKRKGSKAMQRGRTKGKDAVEPEFGGMASGYNWRQRQGRPR